MLSITTRTLGEARQLPLPPERIDDYLYGHAQRSFFARLDGGDIRSGAAADRRRPAWHPSVQPRERNSMADTFVDRKDGLVTLTLNRPDKKNAINAAIWADLDRVLHEVAANPEDRALVLRGAGGNFSAGADLGGGLSGGGGKGLTGGPPQAIVHEMRIVGELINRLHRLPKPTLAVVDGVAVGVALGLVLACDLAIASKRARFCEVFVKRGLALDGGTSWSLPRLIGLRRAKQMAFFGDMLSAEEALSFGLVNEVAPVDQLDALADAWGRRLADGPTTALGLVKRMLDASSSQTFEQAVEDEARAQHISFTTSDMKEGIQAFLERRDPRFTGR